MATDPWHNDNSSRYHEIAGTSDKPFIEFWVWHDGELMPATPDEVEWIHERERVREAQWRLRQWRQMHGRQMRWLLVRDVYAAVAGRLAAWRRGGARSGTHPTHAAAASAPRKTTTER